MAWLLNVDQWDWINPETQKVHRLRRGDKVPGEVLEQEGIDIDELTTRARVPIFVKDESNVDSSPNESARTSGEARSSSPKVAESK